MVVGFKVRATHTGDDTHSPFLSGAQRVAGDKPVMVHLGRFPHTPTITNEALLTTLRPGDVITHAFRAGGGQLDPDSGAVTPEFAAAVERGVRLDVGHSGTDFRYRTARRLFDAGYLPHSISTDLNIYNVDDPVGSLPKTMSKIWALGVDLPAVVAMATIGAGDVDRPAGRAGQPGRRAGRRGLGAAHRGRPGRAVRRPRDDHGRPPARARGVRARRTLAAGRRAGAGVMRRLSAAVAGGWARSMRPDEGSVGRGLAGAAARPPGL